MTCTPLTVLEDLKVLIREGITKICPPGNVSREYEVLRFCLTLGEPGTYGHYLLMGLSTSSGTHMRLRVVILYQPDLVHETMPLTLPWFEPPYLAPTVSDVVETHKDQRTSEEVSSFLKSRYRPKPSHGKQARELRWVTTCLTSDPTEDSFPRYADWESCASLYVAIDICTLNDGIRHSGSEGQTMETSRGFLVLAGCALHFLRKSGTLGLVPDNVEDLAERISFSEVRKRSLQTRFCSVLCDKVNDKDTLLNCGGLILPMGQMTLFLTFALTADDTIRTSLPKEIMLALRSHKALFYQVGLLLTVASFIPATPAYIFQIALLILLYID
jgi:hypothetical protein